MPLTSWRRTAARLVRAPLIALCLAAPGPSRAETPGSEAEPPSSQSVAVHGQLTYVEQETGDFRAPYAGQNSLTPKRGAETTDATLYLGARPWRGAEAWLDAEIDEGHGLDDTLGVAGFPSGEAYKVGRNAPYVRLPRLFVRQTLDLDGEDDRVEASANQLAGTRRANRVVITAGKFSVGDVFDTNRYAHDPRADFLNWAAVDTGTFDYAADAWGYTAGLAVEWYRGPWAMRAGVFDLSDIPNSPDLEPAFHEFQVIVEGERRFALGARTGRALVTAYQSRGRMGVLSDAVSLAASTDTPVDIAAVRRYRSRVGVGLGVEQELTAELGAFLRVGKAQGDVEAYEFTDIDRTQALGLSLRGGRWRRADDVVGLAVIDNGISADRERYLNAGGLGILVGDGKLPHPGPELILETYYSAAVFGFAHLSLDYQWIGHPAYNRDRGPVSVLAVRLHAEF